MKKDHTPWEYQNGTSALHRLSGGTKLAALVLFSLGAFLPGFAVFPCLALILSVLALFAGARPWELLKGSGPLVIFVLFIFGAGAFSISAEPWHISIKTESLLEGFVFSLRILLSFAAGALFFRITSLSQIKKSLTRIEVFLHLEKLRIALCLSLMLAFLPRFFAIWEDISLAWESRAGRKGISKILKMLPVIIERLMEKAAEIACALESRSA